MVIGKFIFKNNPITLFLCFAFTPLKKGMGVPKTGFFFIFYVFILPVNPSLMKKILSRALN